MAVVIQLNFPAKRYHATPWGSHVNEGQIEWPPSPWRILRAFIAVGFTKLGWSQKPATAARTLIAKLASVLPSYALPKTTEAHTRHYVTAGSKKPLIFDTWARIQSGHLQVSWDLELSDNERDLLGQLVSRLTYLGRAESWVSGALLDIGADSLQANAFPAEPGKGAPGKSWEAVTLLAPIAEQDYLEWRAPRVEDALEGLELAKGKKMTKALEKKRVAAVAPFPESLWDCLITETGWLDKHLWSRPPGSRELLYWREPQRSVVQSRRGCLKVAPMEFALFSLDGKNRNKGVLPVLERVYPQARLVHKTLAWFVGEMKAGPKAASSLLGVKVKDGPVQRGHSHAHLLHLDLDEDGHLDHLLLWIPRSFEATVLEVLRSLRKTYTKGEGELSLNFVGSGLRTDFLKTEDTDSTLSSVLGGDLGSRTWESMTPFFVNRYVKKRGKNSLEGQVRRELEQRGLPEAKIEFLCTRADRFRRFRSYIHSDKKHSPRIPQSFALRLRFKEPILGPVCLGYGSHQGLGLFKAVKDE